MEENIVLAGPQRVERELIASGLSELYFTPFGYLDAAGKDLSSLTGKIHDETKYHIPLFRAAHFSHLLSTLDTVRFSEHRKRDSVWLGEGYVVKTAKHGGLNSFFDGDHPHKLKLDRERLAAEIVVAHRMGSKVTTKIREAARESGHEIYEQGLDVVVPICLVEDLAPGRKHNPTYLVERKFTPMPNVSGPLKVEHFSTRAKFGLVSRAYETFLERNERKGLVYVPVDDKKPYADLVLRQKADGSYRVLATDWPHFEKIR